MVWWESAAAPNRYEQPRRLGQTGVVRNLIVEIRRTLGFVRLHGSRRVGSVGAAGWVPSVARRLRFSDGPAATGPRLDGRWEFCPIYAVLTTAI